MPCYTLVKEAAGAGRIIRLSTIANYESASVEVSRNFTNKLWNVSRFVMMNFGWSNPTAVDNRKYAIGIMICCPVPSNKVIQTS